LRVAAIALRIGTASSSHKTKSVFGGAMDRMKRVPKTARVEQELQQEQLQLPKPTKF